MKNFLPFATVTMKSEKVSFSCFLVKKNTETNFFNTIMQLINSNYGWKNRLK